MKGVRGQHKQPGQIRHSQNWIGGTRPGNVQFVPPPPGDVASLLAALERWIHKNDPLPPLVRAGLAHVQFETIHPFLDGNGRIGRLLITLLIEHWGVLRSPLLYLSLAFKRHQRAYYDRLSLVRTEGDWEGWIDFYLACIREAADDGIALAQALFAQVNKDRRSLVNHSDATVSAIRMFDQLPNHPIVTLNLVMEILKTTKPTASKVIELLSKLGILRETTGRQRDRVYGYKAYLDPLAKETNVGVL